MDLIIPPPLVDFIKGFEQLRLKPYYDAAGIPTIGWGHVIPNIDEPPITVEQAQAYLDDDIAHAAEGAERYSPILVSEPPMRAGAIVDFCFNLGTGAYRGSHLRLAVDAADWSRASEEIQRWVYGGGKILPGLVKRRAQEARWLLDPEAA